MIRANRISPSASARPYSSVRHKPRSSLRWNGPKSPGRPASRGRVQWMLPPGGVTDSATNWRQRPGCRHRARHGHRQPPSTSFLVSASAAASWPSGGGVSDGTMRVLRSWCCLRTQLLVGLPGRETIGIRILTEERARTAWASVRGRSNAVCRAQTVLCSRGQRARRARYGPSRSTFKTQTSPGRQPDKSCTRIMAASVGEQKGKVAATRTGSAGATGLVCARGTAACQTGHGREIEVARTLARASDWRAT